MFPLVFHFIPFLPSFHSFFKLDCVRVYFCMSYCVSFLLANPCLTNPTSVLHAPIPPSIPSILPHCFQVTCYPYYSNDVTISPQRTLSSFLVPTCTPIEMHKTEDLNLGSIYGRQHLFFWTWFTSFTIFFPVSSISLQIS